MEKNKGIRHRIINIYQGKEKYKNRAEPREFQLPCIYLFEPIQYVIRFLRIKRCNIFLVIVPPKKQSPPYFQSQAPVTCHDRAGLPPKQQGRQKTGPDELLR